MKTEQCAFCGSNSGPLVPFYALPLALGGGDGETNQINVCNLHNAILTQVRDTDLNNGQEFNRMKSTIDEYSHSLDQANKEKINFEKQIYNLKKEYDSLLEKHTALKEKHENLSQKNTDVNEIKHTKYFPSQHSVLDESSSIPYSDHSNAIEFGENEQMLDISSVELTLKIFEFNLEMTAETFNCSTTKLKNFIAENNIFISNKDETDFENCLIEEDSDTLTGEFIAFSEKNEDIYKVNKLSHCKILLHAIEKGVITSLSGKPIISGISEDELLSAIKCNNWDNSLFKSKKSMQSLLDQKLHYALKKAGMNIFLLSKATGVNSSYIFDAAKRVESNNLTKF